MRRLLAIAAIVALSATASVIWPKTGRAQQAVVGKPEMHDRSEVIGKVLPSVVSITTRKDAAVRSGTEAAGAAPPSTGAYGSGFVIDPSGVIVTNYHVVKDAWEINVTFSDGTWVPARLVTATRLIDIALLKVDVGRPLQAVTWGNSQTLQIGEPVLAIGNALDVGISVSGGLVSAVNRNIGVSPYDDFVQTDAAINHGNSGGPLIDSKGEVVGIDTAIFSPTDSSSGVGFAISSRGAQVVIGRLQKYGWIRPGWVGLKVQQLSPQMGLALGRERAEGAIVANVVPGGAAEAAGLRVGDVIVRVDDVVPTDERALLRTIAGTPIGEKVTFGVWRNGEIQNLVATVREWPRAQWEKVDPPVSLVPSHRRMQPDLGIALGGTQEVPRTPIEGPETGVLVKTVAADTDAAEHGLAAGDVILRVGEKPVSNAAEARAALDAARAEKRAFVLVLVEPKMHKTAGAEWLALRVSDY